MALKRWIGWWALFAVAYAGASLCDAIYAVKEPALPIELDPAAPEMLVCGREYALNVVSNELALTLPQERNVRYRLEMKAAGGATNGLVFADLEPQPGGLVRLRLDDGQLRRQAGTNILTVAVDDGDVAVRHEALVLKANNQRENGKVIAAGLPPGGRYRLFIDNLKPTGKRPNEVEVALCEETSGKACCRRRFNIMRLRRENGGEWEFAVPEDAGRYRLVAFAGVRGSCEGIGMIYKGVALRRISPGRDGR